VPNPLSPLLAALTVVAVAGCGGGGPEATTTPSASVPAPSSAAPSSAVPSSPSPAASPDQGASPAATENGTYATELSVSEDGALSYVPLRWYAGSSAAARCREKAIEPEGAWCTEYYYEEAGGRSAATLIETTRVQLLNDDLKPANASLTDLVQAIEDDVWPYYQVAVSGEQVTRITQVFTP
jgi:predicted small lipoprotein YifL